MSPRTWLLVGMVGLCGATAGSNSAFGSDRVYLLRDCSTQTPPDSSNPSTFLALNGVVLFRASPPEQGDNWYRTDGTAAGTWRVSSLVGGVSTTSSTPVVANGRLIFAGNSGSGFELHFSDGTPEGTYQVADINPGTASSFPRSFAAIGETLYFFAFAPGSGHELWKSDGTPGGTQLVADTIPGASSGSPSNLTVVGTRLIFTNT